MARSHPSLVVPAAVALALLAGTVRGEQEGLDAHARQPVRTVVLDTEDVRPASVTMATGDALVFENHSLQPIAVTFTDPPDVRGKVRCGLVRPTPAAEGRAPWQLFAWEDERLRAVIPPGRFASVCSLAPGTYAFTAVRQGVQARGGATALPPKGQIVVR
jgi:hypothetical protein